MTVGLDTLQPLWLLSTLPMLWLLQRRRARAERVPLPLFPVLGEWLSRKGTLPPKVFRLGRRWRRALAAASLILLALAASRAHLLRQVPIPVARLLVLDNAPGGAVPLEGRPVGEHIRQAAMSLAKTVPSADPWAVLVTSPRPRLVLSPGAIGSVDPAPSAPPVEELAVVAADLVRGKPASEVIVLSPRAEEWRQAIPPEIPVRIPPDRVARKGNAGVTSFLLEPSPGEEGRADLHARIEGWELPSPSLTARVEGAGVRRDVPLTLDGEGRAEVSLRRLPSRGGPLALSLEAGDHFPGDDSAAGRLAPAPAAAASAFTVRTPDSIHPALAAALRTTPGVRLSRGDGPAAVEVIAGTPDLPAPRLPTLVVRPGSDFFGFRFLRLWDFPGEPSFDPSHPITRSLAFRNFRPPRAVEFAPPEGFSTLAHSGGVPLILAGEREGKRVAVWAFDPVGGGIFLDPSFPILLDETLAWLAGKEEAGGGLPGPAVTRAAASLSLPDSSSLDWGEAVARETRRTDLAGFLLGAAILLMLYRAGVQLYPPQEEDEG